MPKLPPDRVPSYRLHKQSGQAIVTLNGADVLLGKFDSVASRSKYDSVIAEWLSGGRHRTSTADLSITELIARYRVHCEAYYRRPDGTPTGEASNIKKALFPLRIMYGNTPAAEFTPLKLKAVRQLMVNPKAINPESTGDGWCRRLVNQSVFRIIAVFRWAAENELLPSSVFTSLQTVTSLRLGRTEARESVPILPVDDATIDATVPFLTSVVTAMVRVQRLTGVRPGEIAKLRTGDIDTTGAVWICKPAQHKTAYLGHQRVISIGPRAQIILQPFLKPLNPAAYIFNPADSVAEVRERRSAARKTPARTGNTIGTNRKRKPRRMAHDHYNTASYRKAIERACDLAFPVPGDLDAKDIPAWKRSHRWHPNRLRHSAATEIRRRFGLEGAQVLLGHASADVTQVYAERDQTAASRIAAEVG